MIIAGILHDTVEDTSVTLGDIRRTFGEEVARLVKGASEPSRSDTWEKRKKHTIIRDAMGCSFFSVKQFAEGGRWGALVLDAIRLFCYVAVWIDCGRRWRIISNNH